MTSEIYRTICRTRKQAWFGCFFSATILLEGKQGKLLNKRWLQFGNMNAKAKFVVQEASNGLLKEKHSGANGGAGFDRVRTHKFCFRPELSGVSAAAHLYAGAIGQPGLAHRFVSRSAAGGDSSRLDISGSNSSRPPVTRSRTKICKARIWRMRFGATTCLGTPAFKPSSRFRP